MRDFLNWLFLSERGRYLVIQVVPKVLLAVSIVFFLCVGIGMYFT